MLYRYEGFRVMQCVVDHICVMIARYSSLNIGAIRGWTLLGGRHTSNRTDKRLPDIDTVVYGVIPAKKGQLKVFPNMSIECGVVYITI